MSVRPSHYVGIINQGNTCYLNSVIQTLYHLPYFRRMIFSLNPKEPDPVLTALKNLFAELEAGNRGITTSGLTTAFGWSARETSVQHDVHELIQQLLDSLEKIVKGTSQETFIRDLFGGTLIYRSRATDGVQYVSDRLEGLYDVELVVEKKSSIEESLKALTVPEKIEGVSIAVNPGEPETKHNIERALSLLKLPPILFVHPNRVSFDMETFEPITLDNLWSFGERLDLAPYMTSSKGLRLDRESTEKLTTLNKSSGSVPAMEVSPLYELRTVLVHGGAAGMGHYYIYVRIAQDKWICFNDDLVEDVSVEDVMAAAFGGDNEREPSGRPRAFGCERAALLAYVSSSCAEAILTEMPAADEVLTLARKLASERSERWTTQPFSYFVADESYIDVLDGVPGAKERLARSVKVPHAALPADCQAAVARQLDLPVEQVRLVNTQFAQSYAKKYMLAEVVPPAVLHARQQVVDADAENAITDAFLFGYLRVCRSADGIDNLVIFHCSSDIAALLKAGNKLYEYKAQMKQLVEVESFDDMHPGRNFVLIKSSVDPEKVLVSLQRRQFKKTEVMFVDPTDRASIRRLFNLVVDDETTFPALQGGIYDLCKKNPTLVTGLPKSHEYIGFFHADDYTGKPTELLEPMSFRASYSTTSQHMTLGILCGRAERRSLYATLLPIPMETVDIDTKVVFRLGWAKMPIVYFTREQTAARLTFADVLAIAFRQGGAAVPESLRARYEGIPADSTGKCAIARIMTVHEGRITSASDLQMGVVLANLRGTVVIDPCSIQLHGYSAVDVSFCSRRRGEDYFGYPTSIPVSSAMSETGSALLQRVAKKLAVPNDEVAVKKWLLYVRKLSTKNIKLCDPRAVLADVVKSIGGGEFEFLIDRPVAVELDGLDAAGCLRADESGGIVIKSASTNELSAM